MKHIIMALIALLPLSSFAQNVWEIPQDEQKQKTENIKKRKALIEKKKKVEPAKYMQGAVPEEDGQVIFTLDKAVPGMSADSIYSKTYAFMQALTHQENQFEVSKIAAVNKQEHTIAARYKEWLVFQNSFLSLDRTVFCYTLIAQCSDQHIKLTMERISYQYEMDRGDNNGLNVKAEEWITDKESINKKGTGLNRMNAKFRRKTIDRKDNIFSTLCESLGIKY